MKKNWITTMAGVLALIATYAKLISDLLSGLPPDLAVTATGTVTGAGLIAAKDFNRQ